MKVFHRGNLNDFMKMKNELLSMKTVFETSETTFTKQIIIHDEQVKILYAEETLTFRDLGLMAKVKKEITANAIEKNISFTFEPEKIKYNVYNYAALTPDTDLFNIVEIDIKAAYFYACLNMGLLSKETFKTLIDLPKLTRLKILGSIATLKTVTTYKNGKMLGQPEQKKNDLTRSAWFAITLKVDEILLNISERINKDFLFYYVDGIYINEDAISESIVEDEITKQGFLFTKKKIDYIRVTKSGNLIVKDVEGARPFYVLRDKIKKYAYATTEQINNYNKYGRL